MVLASIITRVDETLRGIAIHLKRILFLLPFLLATTYTLLAVEVFTYPGFIKANFFLPSQVLVSLLIVIYLFLFVVKSQVTYKNAGNQNIATITSYINSFLLLPLVIIYVILSTLEEKNFPNFVFSHLHIHLGSLSNIVGFNIVIVFLDLPIVKKHLAQRIKKLLFNLTPRSITFFDLSYILTVVALFFLLHAQVSSLVKIIGSEVGKFSLAVTFPYERRLCVRLGGKKCNESFGWIQYYGEFISKHSEDNATIFIPPQKESWEMEGNVDFIRAFIYPRVPISSQELSAPIPSEADYVLIAYGSWYSDIKGWPRFLIPKERIEWIRYIDRYTLEEDMQSDTDYIFEEGAEEWGLIKMKK